jgi:plastocyanin
VPLRTTLAVALALAAAVGGCGGSDGSATTTTAGCTHAVDGRITLVADDLAWDTDCLVAEAGPLTIVVDNRDESVSHNVHLPDAPGSPATDLEPGPVRQELEVDLAPGSYEYLCDLHPSMVGTLTVPAPDPPG